METTNILKSHSMMDTSVQSLESMLKAIERQMSYQRDLHRIKGETFNIFSILDLKTNEVRTHSRFLAELLDPHGSHLMGDIFLKAFLRKIDYKKPFNTASAELILEKGIGVKTLSSGGIIDILIKDCGGNTIAIENKIYAGDQENQIVRYYNYNRSRNTVYYLTLNGSEPSIEAKGDLKSDQDFYLISYGQHIKEWLHRCQEIAVDVPQVREGIKQYYLLIKNLTNLMINPNDIIIRNLLFDYAESSQFIADNFQSIKNEIKETFRNEVAAKLNEALNDGRVRCIPQNKVSGKGIAQIFVYLNNYPNEGFLILIETFSGFSAHGPNMFIGLVDGSRKHSDYPLSGEVEKFDTDFWKATKFLAIDNEPVNLEDINFLKKILDPNSEQFHRTVSEFVKQCLEFINRNYPLIEEYFAKRKMLNS